MFYLSTQFSHNSTHPTESAANNMITNWICKVLNANETENLKLKQILDGGYQQCFTQRNMLTNDINNHVHFSNMVSHGLEQRVFALRLVIKKPCVKDECTYLNLFEIKP